MNDDSLAFLGSIDKSQRRSSGFACVIGEVTGFLLGASLALVAIAVITGFDRTLQTFLVAAMPASLTGLATRF